MKNRPIIEKVFISLAAIALIALAVFIFSKGTKKTPENLVVQTENAKGIFQNDQYYFTLKYPEDWYYTERKGGELTPYSILLSPDADFVEYGRQIPNQAYPDKFINVVLVKTNQTVDVYATTDLVAKNASVRSRKQLQIGSHQGVSFVSRLKDKTYLSAYVKYDKYIYEFESVVPPNQVEVMRSYFNNVIDSFQFKPIPQSQELQGWKTYFNTAYNYQFKYPGDWQKPEQSITTDRATFYKDSSDGGANAFVVVQAYNIRGLISVDDRFKAYHQNDRAKYELVGGLIVDGYDAKRYDEVGGLGEKHVIFEQGSLMFDIYSTVNDQLFLNFARGFRYDNHDGQR